MNEERIRQIRKDLDVPFDQWADKHEDGGSMSKVYTLEVYLREVLDEGLPGCARCETLQARIDAAKRALSHSKASS